MNKIYNKFSEYISSNKLFDRQDKILLAVSGGRDSMLMLRLFEIGGFDIAVAHFNHKTREGESDKDEAFVKEYCSNNNIEFYSHTVDVKAIIKDQNKGNFQDVARKLRYLWLGEIKNKAGCKYIATAHHIDDNIETFLFYLARGMDISLLQGILPSNGDIIRPLLGLSREDINEYVNSQNIPYREDKSNADVIYARNMIRHEIIPRFENIFPNFKSRIQSSIISNVKRNTAFDFLLKEYLKKYVQYEGSTIKIDKEICSAQDDIDILYYFLSDYGFNKTQYNNILNSCEKSGSMFYAGKYTLLVDRQYLILKEIVTEDIMDIQLFIGDNVINDNTILRLSIITPLDISDMKNTTVQYLDNSKIHLPLKLRKWRKADFFHPFGLKGKSKKLKKLFTDKKLTVFDKHEQLVLVNNDEICAVLSMDIDYNYRVDENTKEVLKIEVLQK